MLLSIPWAGMGLESQPCSLLEQTSTQRRGLYFTGELASSVIRAICNVAISCWATFHFYSGEDPQILMIKTQKGCDVLCTAMCVTGNLLHSLGSQCPVSLVTGVGAAGVPSPWLVQGSCCGEHTLLPPPHGQQLPRACLCQP